MTRHLLITAALTGTAVLTGCFYTDPINQRPSLEIHRPTPGPVSRGQTVTFDAIATDPDGDSVALVWRAYACTGTACDATEFVSGADTHFTVTVPTTNAELLTFDTLEIRLEGHDALGATAKPSQVLDLPLEDAAPTLELRKDPRPAYVVGTPIGLYAQVGDPDDGPDKVQPLEWIAYAPPDQQSAPDTLVDLDVADPDPQHYLQFGKTFTPAGIGDWDIQVTAKDPQDTDVTPHRAVQHLAVHVAADHAPCLAQWDPAATSDPGTTIPISDPTLFQVLVVADDLDPYPPVANDPILGTTEFHWSIVPPSGTRQSLPGVTGSGIALDPASYLPGDIVELRVEIQDRTHIAVNCPDGDLTCSVISDASCLQRLTWRVEVR